jgi:hypothetical protein
LLGMVYAHGRSMTTKRLLLIPACLPLLGGFGLGCADVSDAVDDATTVTVGADSLRAVEIERSMALEAARIPGCLDFSATIPSSDTTVALSNGPMGCTLTVEQPDLVLLDEQAIERAREEVGNFDVDGIRSATLEVQSLELSTGDGTPLELAQQIDAVTLTVDGEVLLDRVSASELGADAMLTREVPAPLLEELKTSLKANQAATADVVISLWLRSDGLPELPDTLNMRVVIQPELEVNVVDAVL